MPATPELVANPQPAQARYWLTPLNLFHQKRGIALPPIRFIDAGELPEPQRSLLSHDSDMTPVLTAYHGSPLGLEVLDREVGEHYLLRLVNLRRQDSLKVVECGAIGIQLGRFSRGVRALIEECQVPLGEILQRERVAHRGNPRGFFQVSAETLVCHALGEPPRTRLYGRCNELSFRDGISFANVVEILPSAC